jgi:phage gp36-like protein
MPSPALYCTVDDVLALVSLDAQARMATDPQIAVPLAARGDGLMVAFDTPFRYSTAITTTVAGVPTASTLASGTGTNGVDQVIFATPPNSGDLLMAKADINAVNVSVVAQCVALASNKLKGCLARYGTENLPADVLAILQPKAVFFTRWYLRMRRSMSEEDPIRMEYKAENDWIMAVATGKIALPASAPIATAASFSPQPIVDTPSVFDAPYSKPNDFFGP